MGEVVDNYISSRRKRLFVYETRECAFFFLLCVWYETKVINC